MSSVSDCSIIQLPKIEYRTGNISLVEGVKNFPFRVKRVFYLYDIPAGESRGAHAHKECHQFLIAASGSFEIILDDGTNEKKVTLNRPFYGLHIPPLVWAYELNFSSGAIALVLTSDLYDGNDYIRDYSTYKKLNPRKVSIEIINYSDEFLRKSWFWLRDPEIKELTLTPSFSEDTQKQWFKSLSSLKDYYIKGILINEEAAGAFGLKHITEETAEFWGYIGERKYWGQGFGSIILTEAIKYAKVIKLKSLYLKVSDSNIRAINLYISHGFKFKDKKENVFFMTLVL
jgi:RimJ/RimL family protein N-acetyltransferase